MRGREALRRLAMLPVLVLLLAAGGCGRTDTGRPTLERVNPDTLSGDTAGWFQQHRRQAGTYTLNSGGRTYVLVAWGEKPTGGYSVRIEDVAQGSAGMVVAVRLESPQPGQAVTQAITYPSDLVAVPENQQAFTFAFLGREAEALLTKPAAPPEAAPQTGAAAEKPVAESTNFRVYEPRPGDTAKSPLRVRGQARVFEAAFSLELEDGHNVLARQNVMASAGGPAWGDFDVQLKFERPTSPSGTLLFITYSAKDGSRQEELAVPVKFADFGPAGG